mmetsp:Transcript_15323/g.31576  ORF Transcript_15323/g.31576 Transcript_15323/m.31576 type:complete len:219 (-) Transcript_15323:1604-2260(-)
MTLLFCTTSTLHATLVPLMSLTTTPTLSIGRFSNIPKPSICRVSFGSFPSYVLTMATPFPSLLNSNLLCSKRISSPFSTTVIFSEPFFVVKLTLLPVIFLSAYGLTDSSPIPRPFLAMTRAAPAVAVAMTLFFLSSSFTSPSPTPSDPSAMLAATDLANDPIISKPASLAFIKRGFSMLTLTALCFILPTLSSLPTTSTPTLNHATSTKGSHIPTRGL